MIEISYLTDISKPYVDGIKKCSSKTDLLKFINEYKEICHDALEQADHPDFLWEEYQKGWNLEKKGKYAGDKWVLKYGAILMPEIIMFIGLQAQRFMAPEGTVFIRLRDMGILKKRKDGIYWLDIPRENNND